jgi:hypothetical protein
MSATSGHKINSVNLQPQELKRARSEAQIEVLEHLKAALCIRELSNSGRAYINRIIIQKRHELDNT